MSYTGWVVAQILASILFFPHSYEQKTVVGQNEQTLIQGISEETSEEWIGFLLAEGVGFSIQGSGSNVMVADHAIEILEKAKQVEVLQAEAERAMAERRIEARITELWPRVPRASVCISPESTDPGTSPRTNDAVFVVAPNFPREQKADLHEVIEEFVPGIDSRRIQILGSVESGGEKDRTRIARGNAGLSTSKR